jgi:ERCC4-type nuclease
VLGGLKVDPRAGSEKLIEPLRGLGVKVEAERMEFGDVSFLANLSEGIVPVGIEFKTLYDVLGCITDGRFVGHQLPGLLDTYGVVVLLLQGQYRPGVNGQLLVKRKRWGAVPYGRKQWLYRHVSHWLWSIRFAGVTVIETPDLQSSCAAIKALYTWGQKEWEDHKTLKVIHTRPDRIPMVRPSKLKKGIYAMVDGLGWEKAGAAAEHFGTPQRMTNADEESWRQVAGIDKVLAKRAVRVMTTRGMR